MTHSDEDKEDIAKLLMEATYHQVFVADFFGDPHPGNLLITADKRRAIDFGAGVT